MTANADTAVCLHAQKHTTPPTVAPGWHPWHVIMVHLPTGTNTEEAQQVWTDRWSHVCITLHEGLQQPSLTRHTLQPVPTTAEFDTRTAPPTGVWCLHAHPQPRGSSGPQDHHLQPPRPCAHPPRSHAKRLHPIVATPRARKGPPTTSQPAWPRPGPHSNRPCCRRHGPASWGTTPMGTVRHQRGSGTPQSSIRTLQGKPHQSTPTRPRPPYPRWLGGPHPRAPRYRTQSRGRDSARHQTTPQHHNTLQHTNTKRHRHPQHRPQPLLPPSHA